ncbi:MAG TPA: redoxin family protein [Verrucomicrobiae bacterium]|nr:redoxin family protein [Verrucomicrobiae bacterium]
MTAAIAGLLALAVFNLLLLKQNRALRLETSRMEVQQRTGSDRALLWLSSANSPICQLTLQKKGAASYQPALSLLVFLSPKDCSACLEEAEVWEKLYEKFSPRGFFVLGIVREADSLWADEFSTDYELTFPMASLDSATLEYLGVPSISPFKVMVDSLRRIVYLSGPNSEPEEQNNFAEVAEKLCRAYLTP